MAIVVEEEKRSRVGLMRILIWLAALAMIGAAVYYVLIKKPEGIPQFLTPAAFRNTAELSKIRLDPGAVVNNPSFQVLREYVPPPTVGTTGRANPFLGF